MQTIKRNQNAHSSSANQIQGNPKTRRMLGRDHKLKKKADRQGLTKDKKVEAINHADSRPSSPSSPPMSTSPGRQGQGIILEVEVPQVVPESWEELRERGRRYLLEWEEIGEAVPSVSGLARWLGVSRSRSIPSSGREPGIFTGKVSENSFMTSPMTSMLSSMARVWV